MKSVGYASITTPDDTLDAQIDALRAAGCDLIFSEIVTGPGDPRPQLSIALDALARGDEFVAMSMDRISRESGYIALTLWVILARRATLRLLSDR